MVWWIAGGVIALVLFIAWIAWEMAHAPTIDDIFGGMVVDSSDLLKAGKDTSHEHVQDETKETSHQEDGDAWI